MSVGRPKDVLVLAGGFGTRLRSVVADVPKPMAPIAGRPFLEYLLDYWIDRGAERFVLSIGYLADVISGHFGNVYRGASIEYIREDQPLGTGGAVRLALQCCAWPRGHCLLINGDTWFEADPDQLTADAARLNALATLALKPLAENDRYGGVAVASDGRIEQFGVKQEGAALINAGCYLLDTDRLEPALRDYPESFSFEGDFLVAAAPEGVVAASIQDRRFLDIGVPEDYLRAERYIVSP